jgi:regulator of protease activity HflC (stomatin/prohibitin superfamily)
VLERGARFSRATGPGLVFLEPGERILTTLDLRKQSRSQAVAALTKDGIEVKTTVGVTFGLAVSAKESDGDADDAAGAGPGAARLKRMYDFDPRVAFKASYCAAAGSEAPVGWTELPQVAAAECFRALLARQTLDDLLRPLDPKTFPLQDFNRRLTEDVSNAPILRDCGIHVFGVSVGAFDLPLEVQKQRVASWEAEWNRRAQVALASGDLQAEKIKQRARTQAQAEVTAVLRAALKPDNEVWTVDDKERIARRIMGALQQLAPRTRRAQVGDTVRMLADLRTLLDVPPGAIGPLLGEGQVSGGSAAGTSASLDGTPDTSHIVGPAGPDRSGQREAGS